MKIENASFSTGSISWFIKNASFEGKFIAVFGPSGIGKSTFLQALSGILPMDSYKGEKLPSFQYIFQDFGLIDFINVKKNILLSVDKSNFNESDLLILKSLEIEQLLDRSPVTLSGGEKARVAIARALIDPRRYLLADEAFCSLDQKNKEKVYSLFFELMKKKEKVFFVSHSVDEVLRFADQVVFFENLDSNSNRLVSVSSCFNKIKLNDLLKCFRLDTGSQVNIAGRKILKLNDKNLFRKTQILDNWFF